MLAKIKTASCSLIMIVICTFTINACSNNPYAITFNDNVIYSPNASTEEEIFSDANLEGCLKQTFISTATNDLNDITLLTCPAAGISSLIGIENLPNLEQLDLSDNGISDLAPLYQLKKLRLLSMHNNSVRNVTALFSLPTLRFVSLIGNNNISCKQLDSLEQKLGNSLNRPIKCR